MEYKIRKMEQGSGFATFTPIIHTAPARSSSSSDRNDSSDKTEESSSIIDPKTIQDLYKEGGLTNDVTKLVKELIKIEQSNTIPFMVAANRMRTIQIAGEINRIKENKDYWLDTKKRAEQEGGINEVAVNNDGRVYARDSKGNINKISLDEYTEDRENYQLMSVGQLLKARQFEDNLAGNTEFFDIPAIGMDKITAHMKDMVAALGEETSTSSDIYSKAQSKDLIAKFGGKQPNQAQEKSISILNKVINSPSEYSTVELSTTTQRNHLNEAADYIWTTLGTPAQQKLAATAALNGINDPRKFILSVLGLNTNNSNTIKISPETTAKATGVKESTGEGGEKPISTFEVQNNSKMGMGNIAWNDVSTGLTMNLSGNQVSLWDNVSNNSMIKMGPLSTLLNSHTGALLQQNNVFFGDKKTNLSDQQNIIIDPSSGSARVYFPVKSDGSPNYDLMKTIEAIQKEAPKTLTPDELTKYFADKGFSFIQFDKNFQIKQNSNFKPFLLLYGFADEKSNTVNGNKEIKKLKGDESSETDQVVTAIWEKEKIKSPTGVFNWSNTFYKGNILIPYQEDAPTIAASLAGNLISPRPTLEEAKEHKNVDKARVISASSDIFKKQ